MATPQAAGSPRPTRLVIKPKQLLGLPHSEAIAPLPSLISAEALITGMMCCEDDKPQQLLTLMLNKEPAKNIEEAARKWSPNGREQHG